MMGYGNNWASILIAAINKVINELTININKKKEF